MGGRGTYAVGNNVKYQYKTIGKINDVKILKGTGNLHDLPVEAHSSNAYIEQTNDGRFCMMRIYDANHYLIKEIAYHPETDLAKSRQPILHIHECEPGNLSYRPSRLFSKDEYERYKQYFIGELRWKME